MQRIPFDLPAAEFRGVTKQAGEFTRRDTGEVIATHEKLIFEHVDAEGTLVPVELGASGFDKVQPPLDWRSFAKGDTIHLRGVCVMYSAAEGKDSYPTLTGASAVTGKAALKAA